MNENQIICGNKIFTFPDFKENIYLPDSIRFINGKEVDYSIMNIPKNVTSLDNDCFNKCYQLTHLSIPSSVKYFNKDISMKLEFRRIENQF